MKLFLAVILTAIFGSVNIAYAGEFSGLSAATPNQTPPTVVNQSWPKDAIILISCTTTNQSALTGVAAEGGMLIELDDPQGKEVFKLAKNVGEVNYDFAHTGNHFAVTLTIPNGTFTYQLIYADTGSALNVLRDGKLVNSADCSEGTVKSDLLSDTAKKTFNR